MLPPEFFAELSCLFVDAGNDVYIITGSMKTSKLEGQLKDWGIAYTHFFSVSDYLIEQGEAVRYSDPENPWFDEEVWRRAKGDYCKRVGIDMHIDDTERYAKHFKDTKFMLVNIK